jgi:DHA2 family multidrug resistance protein
MSTVPGAAAHGSWKPAANPWLIAVAVTLAAFMEVLDTTIVNVALPHIAGTMSASYDQATWALTAYLVANGIVLPMSAFLARTIGRKRYFLICIIAFTACSFACGVSTNLYELILFRVLQGFFGGGLQPVQQSIILDTFPSSQRGRAFAVTAVAIVVAPVFGPTLGGWITDNLTWRWVFLINVPIGIMTAFAVMHLVEDPPWEKIAKKVDFDFVGIGLITLGLGSLQVVLDRGEDADWFASNFIRTFSVMAFIGLSAAVTWLLYTRKPVVDLRTLKDKNFTLGCMTIAAFASILYASAVLIPQLTQQHLGYTAMLSGLVLSPGALLIIFLIPIINQVMHYVQMRYILSAGFFFLGCALLYSRGLTPDIDFKTLVIMRATQSLAIGFLFVPASTLTYLTLSKHLQGDGAALFTMFRNIAGSIGISLSTAAISSRTQVHLAILAGYTGPLNPGYNFNIERIVNGLKGSMFGAGDLAQTAAGVLYRGFLQQASILAYMDVFALCAILSWCFIPFTFFFSPAKGKSEEGAH